GEEGPRDPLAHGAPARGTHPLEVEDLDLEDAIRQAAPAGPILLPLEDLGEGLETVRAGVRVEGGWTLRRDSHGPPAAGARQGLASPVENRRESRRRFRTEVKELHVVHDDEGARSARRR